MEKDIVDGKVGELAAYDIEFKGGHLVAKLNAALSPVSAEIKVQINADALIDAIEKAIPGDWDKMPLATLKGILKS